MKTYSKEFNFYLLFSSNWIVLLLIYSSSRLAFLLFNQKEILNYSIFDFLEGVRFDLSALAYINSVYFLIACFALSQPNKKNLYRFNQCIFIVTNGVFVVLNNIDIAYFNFNLKRSSSEIINLVANSPDIIGLIPQFIINYWPVSILTILQIWLLGNANRFSNLKMPTGLGFYGTRIIIIITTTVLFARGGFQIKPVKPINAGEIFKSSNTNLILNTPFYFIHTFEKSEFKKIEHFSNTELKKIFDPCIAYNEGDQKKLNVIILIVESLSKEFVGYYNNGNGFTPFLDNLMQDSLVFENAFANGLRSIDAIPAVISSIPNLQNDPFINSKYSNNSIPSLSEIFRNEGYKTYFFHGGKRGTMGFYGFCNRVKFEHYIGMEEFPDKAYFDGSWGIYDEPFLKFAADQIEKNKSPFFATIFTLSSHPPYNLPQQYENVFPEGLHRIHELIGYVDLSLKRFFDNIKHKKWFNKTLFIITSDHTSNETFEKNYSGYLNRHKIPLIFYMGDNSLKGKNYNITQQIDIMPTILDFIDYQKPFFSFGKSALGDDSWALIGNENELFLISESGILKNKKNQFTNFHDFNLSLKSKIDFNAVKKLQAIEQSFNNRMITNNLNIDNNSIQSDPN